MDGLKTLKLVNYKGFANYSISLRRSNVLVGANNAGKSTALGALRLVIAMLPQARRIHPPDTGEIGGMVTRGWSITSAAIEASAFSPENIRHDFRQRETRIEVTTMSGARLIAAWPAPNERDDAGSGMYFVLPPSGSSKKPRAVAESLTPRVAIVPTLTPLDDHEVYVGDETLRRHQTSRRASRYLRNTLWRLDAPEWKEFTQYVYDRTPELADLSIHRRPTESHVEFDLFYVEPGTRQEREIGWAGDGIQIWLQAMYHLWRQRDADVVVLDEPDVFLHPDLQRRLARALFATDQQVIVATHSVEILAEADPGSAVWVDRSRRSAERPRNDGALAMMGRRLGSGYELGVGRALRSQFVLFVEGDDAPILAHIARNVGCSAVSSSDAYATVPLGGFTRNWRAGAFSETMTTLGTQIRTFVILDSDLRSPEAIAHETRDIKASGGQVHVWRRRELENYLLVPAAISGAAGIPNSEAESILYTTVAGLEAEARVTLEAQRLEEQRTRVPGTSHLSSRSVLEAAKAEFDDIWSTNEGRLAVVDAKRAIKGMNTELQRRGAKTLNAHSLARSIPAHDVPDELRSLIVELEGIIRSGVEPI